MDNNQNSLAYPTGGQSITPAQPTTQQFNQTMMQQSQQPQQFQQPVAQFNNGDEKKTDVSNLIKIITIILLSLVSATFIGLFIWMVIEYNGARSDVDGQIAVAVTKAKDEQALKLENEFLEREKNPYETFRGPADYGELSFKYPKTWSVYVSADASKGGDYEAYFNPVQVDVVAKTTINALRLKIRNESFESVAEEYQKDMDGEDANLTVETMTIQGMTANRYTGTIPDTEFSGYIVIFKIRDKTAVFQTDSVLFKDDFDKLLETITFKI